MVSLPATINTHVPNAKVIMMIVWLKGYWCVWTHLDDHQYILTPQREADTVFWIYYLSWNLVSLF